MIEGLHCPFRENVIFPHLTQLKSQVEGPVDGAITNQERQWVDEHVDRSIEQRVIGSQARKMVGRISKEKRVNSLLEGYVVTGKNK